MALYIGIDLGTSGCRAIAIDADRQLLAEQNTSLPRPLSPQSGWHEQDANLWWQAALEVLRNLLDRIDTTQVRAICVDGTSSTLLLCDSQGEPLSPALMYNDSRSQQAANHIGQFAPSASAALGPNASLAKLLYLQQRHPQARHALHQADWVAGKLVGQFGFSDANNCLKMGFIADRQTWPEWIRQTGINSKLLPRVYTPGNVIARIDTQLAKTLGLAQDTRIIAGTTDSTAAFIATGAAHRGEAVTSLGSTLVTKVIADAPLFASEFGVYSHRLFGHWLAGGASNSGGAALLQCFSIAEMEDLTPLLDPQQDSGLDYYPLPATGERFPHADPSLSPRMPLELPADRQGRAHILQGLLEGVSRIEAQAYRLLENLGAPYPTRILTVGGGAVNSAWTLIRQRYLGLLPVTADHNQAAYGAALLARHGDLDDAAARVR